MAFNLQKILVKIFGSRNDRLLKRYWKLVDLINAQEEKVRQLTDDELRQRTYDLHIGLAGDPVKRTKPTMKSEDVIPEALAILREAMDRNIGLRTVFNPEENEMGIKFDPDKLDPEARKMYDDVKAQLEAVQPQASLPVGAGVVGGGMFDALQQHAVAAANAADAWRRVPIPVALYNAIRKIYPESRPPFRARPFDVQMIGGMVMYEGKIAEMATGEGKTFVAPLACFLRVLEGYHCHVVTVNDYLVKRDASWIRPAFAALGLSVSYIQSDMDPGGEERKAAYLCDVTYGTNSEFGFDYLRDNMKGNREAQVQGPLDFAIVDEVDSILIDEARTPLIISGPAHDDAPRYRAADEVARKIVELHKPFAALERQIDGYKRIIKGAAADLERAKSKEEKEAVRKKVEQAQKDLEAAEEKKETVPQYYEVEWDRKSAHLTHVGIDKAQEIAGVGSFYVGNNVHWPHLMDQALRAHVVYERDKDYVVDRNPRSGEVEVIIVDESTGRKMIGRQWSDGLHQAVEAKERVQIKQDTQTVATVTIQNFCKLYRALSGMTGTAQTEAEEFMKIYKLEVVTIPTNRPVVRKDREDRVYRREQEKWDAIIEEIKLYSDAGRPVLVGTTSVEKSEMLSARLMRKYGIQHEVLNAKQHERESHIVALAGQTHVNHHGVRVGNVTIATNMAGRGTDIKLAPEVVWEVLQKPSTGRKGTYVIRQRGTGIEQTIEVTGSEENENPLADVYQLDAEAKLVGGLHVIGTERHTARRIDNQLRGRAGRQGDAGSSRFYVSLEDELMKIFAGDWTIKVLGFLGMEEGQHIEDKRISKGIMRAQKKVEERNFLGRKNLLEYDEVMDFQRTYFYRTRQQVLEGRNVDKLIWEMIGDAIRDAVDKYIVKDHVAATIAEWSRVNADVNIDAADIAGRRDADALEDYIRSQARVQVGEDLQSTLGEFLGEDDGDRSGWDTAGLSSWAMSRFKVNLPQSRIKKMDIDQLREMLRQAADEQIEKLDLSGLQKYLEPLFSEGELAEWAKAKFDIEVAAKEFVNEGAKYNTPKEPDEIVAIIETKARELYARREVEFPVDFLLSQAAGEANRIEIPDAGKFVAQVAYFKYGVELTYDEVMNAPLRDLRQKLVDLQTKALQGGGVEADVNKLLEAQDGKPPTPEVVCERFGKRFGKQIEVFDLFPDQDDNPVYDGPAPDPQNDMVVMRQSLEAQVRNLLRDELNRIEQYILLEKLDERWKDHLYAMDMLKSGIGLVGFAEKDPRVVFKKEGHGYFNQMLQAVRDQVTDLIFRVQVGGKLQTQDNYGQTEAVHQEGGSYGVAETLQQSTALEPSAASVASEEVQGEGTTVRQIVNDVPKVGRNDPCPCGSGRKYKKCHGQEP